MTKIAAQIARASAPRRSVVRPAPPQSRPGWILELAVAVLASSNEPLSPQEVISQAERACGRRLVPSSIRNALRAASQRGDGSVERVGYGKYRLDTRARR